MKRAIYLKILFTGIFLLTLISLSYSAEWEIYSKTDLNTFYYDKKNIKHMPNNVIRVWTKLLYSDSGKERLIKTLGDDDFKNLANSVSLIQINCTQMTYDVLNIAYYDSKGSVIISSEKPQDKTEEFVMPDSTTEKLYEIVCKETKQ